MKLNTILLVTLKKENWWVKDLVNVSLVLTTLISHQFFLSVTTGSISIVSFATVIGAPVETASASFSLDFQFLHESWKNC